LNEMRRLVMNRILRYFLLYGLIFLAIMGIFSSLNKTNPKMQEIRYDQLITSLEKGDVETLTLQPLQHVLQVKGKMKGYKEGESFVANVLDGLDIQSELKLLAKETKTEITVLPAPTTSAWVSFFTGLVPFIIIFVLFFFLLNQAQGGGGGRVMNFGKSKAKLHTDDKKKVRFTDVAGADEEKAELVEVVDFLKDSRKFVEVGARIPKGILLVGPPGSW
jgi:cell division protease FtsH